VSGIENVARPVPIFWWIPVGLESKKHSEQSIAGIIYHSVSGWTNRSKAKVIECEQKFWTSGYLVGSCSGKIAGGLCRRQK
jgi:hypothetical protein